MSCRLPLLLTLLLGACVPWNEIHGPTVGAGVVYEEHRGFSPQLTAGYAYERFKSWYGYGADARVAVEPWRHRVTFTPRILGSFLFWELGVGPTASWAPGDLTFGFAISAGARLKLGAPNTCMNARPENGDCLGEDDTVPVEWLPRLRVDGGFLADHTFPMSFGGDVIARPRALGL
jgi:hypothetical protein